MTKKEVMPVTMASTGTEGEQRHLRIRRGFETSSCPRDISAVPSKKNKIKWGHFLGLGKVCTIMGTAWAQICILSSQISLSSWCSLSCVKYDLTLTFLNRDMQARTERCVWNGALDSPYMSVRKGIWSDQQQYESFHSHRKVYMSYPYEVSSGLWSVCPLLSFAAEQEG